MPKSPTILRSVEASAPQPTMLIRQAGDHQVLVEYEGTDLDLRLNFRVHALRQVLATNPVEGVLETAPGFRSMMVTFDPATTSRDRLLDELVDRERRAPSLSSLVLTSRILKLPIAFDDEMTREAVRRYRITTRNDAPNVRDGDNIDYIVRYNGFTNREEFFDHFLSATWWNAFVGYFPGLPSLFSLDPLTQISTPKYNPARMWTAEGAVGMGGPCVVLYPMESPGSYQLFGRTLPLRVTRNVERAAPTTVEDATLFRTGDRVNFSRVTEKDLLAMRLQVMEGTYTYEIEHGEFVVAEYLHELARHAPEAAKIAADRRLAAASVEIP